MYEYISWLFAGHSSGTTAWRCMIDSRSCASIAVSFDRQPTHLLANHSRSSTYIRLLHYITTVFLSLLIPPPKCQSFLPLRMTSCYELHAVGFGTRPDLDDLTPFIGEKTARAPVWIMRQAGRYLPGSLHRIFVQILVTAHLL